MTKTLVMARHGHRDTTRRELDNGLDSKGRDQAKAIRHFFMERFEGVVDFSKVRLVSSPKLRCLETLKPLSKALGVGVEAHALLDEQFDGESTTDFAKRVRRFLDEWQNSNQVLTVLCGHGDWIPLASNQLVGLRQESKKGSWLELEGNKSGRAILKWYIPTFKPFYSQN